jgi:AsmA-like C-terminal region/Protein of unknown function
VRRVAGQAARHTGKLLHLLAELAIGLAVLVGVLVGALSWRLAQGPLELPWLARRLEAAANAGGGPTQLTIGSMALAWEGFRLGADRPIDFRVADIAVSDANGRRRVEIPTAEITLSLRAAMLGRVVPRLVMLDGAKVTLIRARDGTLSVDLGSLTEAIESDDNASAGTPLGVLYAELARPPSGDFAQAVGLLSQIRGVHIRNAQVAIVDRQLGISLHSPNAQIEINRHPAGGLDGTADLPLELGDQRARLTASATLAAGANETQLRARLTPVVPAALAQVAPSLAPFSAVEVPVAIAADLILDPRSGLRNARLIVNAGAGKVRIAGSNVPIKEAALVAAGTPDAFSVETLRVALPGRGNASGPVISARGTVQRATGRVDVDGTVEVDRVDFADVGHFWPDEVGGHARQWIVENITAGTARNAHVDFGIAARPDFSSIELVHASGTINGDGLTVHWLRPILPIENGQARLTIVDPDTLQIDVASGREALRAKGSAGLAIRGGSMRISGIMQPHQLGTIVAEIAGPLPDAIALLREPRLGLLVRHPIEFKNATGQTNVKLRVSLPLEQSVSMDDIGVHAQGRLDAVHVSAIAAGHDLDDGELDIEASNVGMKLSGHALLSMIPAKVDASMDFRAGAQTQVLQTVTVSGEPDAQQLAAAGLDVTSMVTGAIPLQATLTEQRNGRGELTVQGDLTKSEMTVPGIGWRKPSDVAAQGQMRIMLDHDRFASVDLIQIDGKDLAVRGVAQVANDKLVSLRFDQLVFGRTNAQATLRMASGQSPITVSLSGPVIDLADYFTHRPAQRGHNEQGGEPPPGPPWTLDAKFDRAMMAQGRVFGDVKVHAENDGRVYRLLHADGSTGANVPFRLDIVPQQTGRELSASAANAGELLRGLDLVRTMQGGRLTVSGKYADGAPGRPLSGTADIEDFRVRDAPALAKLLQAMTLYGLVEVMQGPGLGFSSLIAPFRYSGDILELSDARAFSPSLGLTMKGRIDLGTDMLNMQGTIVPAYFFNALLGHLPVIGRLFSPERGGGVFAASYTLNGALRDPQVFVNPLTTLTPGFLRGLFGFL